MRSKFPEYLLAFKALKMTFGDGNYVSFNLNFQQSPRLLELCGGGEIEKVWGTFSTLFMVRSSFPLPFYLSCVIMKVIQYLRRLNDKSRYPF